MWPVLVAGAVGFFAAGRTQPKTKCERKVVLGARTGRTYDVEEFPEAGFLVVRAKGPEGEAHGVFQHAQQKTPADPRFSWRGGQGNRELLHGMCLDLGIVREPESRQQTANSSGSGPQDAGRKTPSANNVVQHPASQKAVG